MIKLHTLVITILIFLLIAPSVHSQEDAYTVQVAACELRESAERMVADLKTKGYTPYIHKHTDENGNTLYLVRLEDFSLMDSAKAAVNEYKAKTGSEAMVTRTSAFSPMKTSATEKAETATVPMTGGDEPVVAQPPVAAPAVMSYENKRDPDQRMNDLQEELETLQQEMKQLREQQEARRKLEITEDEKAAKEKEILQAAGREYTTMKKNTLGLEYNFNYQYYSYDVITRATEIEQHANHNITNSIFAEYALLDNLTLNLNVPFSYKWDNTGTDQSKEVTDLGDVSVGFQYQPLRTGGSLPTSIVYGSFSFPMGRSPYEINIDEDLATGNGYYSASAGLSLSKTIDPIIAFGNIGYTYNFTEVGLSQPRNGLTLNEVDPGDSISGTIGMGFSLSYNVSMNFSYQYTYRFGTTYTWREIPETESGTQTSSLLYIGTGWRFSPKHSLNMKVGIGLTNEDPDFVVSFRIPFEFDLSD
ncbi:MAG: SPOR domain-containing protein [Deltaproteobacteria bacterium]|nr:SPOR domain-containing protein [Deltaproteobacteria bacterium]